MEGGTGQGGVDWALGGDRISGTTDILSPFLDLILLGGSMQTWDS